MQALRHASRQVFHASVVMQEICAASVRAYSSEAASTAAARKSKEERCKLVKQFVASFKAENDGRLPGITLLRKEVGGKYEILKEILQELEKGKEKPDTLEPAIELKDTEEKRQKSAAAVKGGKRKISTVKEDSKKVSKGVKAVTLVDQTHSKATSKDMVQTIQPVMPIKDASKHAMDALLTLDEDDEDDSDVAAPEYNHTPSMQVAHHKMEDVIKAEKGKEKVLGSGPKAHLKNDMKKQNADQAIKSKHADIKKFEVQDGGKKTELSLKGRDADNTATKHPVSDGNFGHVNKPYSYAPLTTIVRIINLPTHVTATKLQALCESVASVHEVNLRRGRIADVQFNVDIQEMGDVLNRLRSLTIRSSKLRVFPAHKFSRRSKPQDINHYRQVRNVLLYSLEQRFRFLCWQVQDYRELQDLKLAK